MHVKQSRTRTWCHLDSCQFKTFIEADVPVVECEEHGGQTVQVPWAEKSIRFTLLFERFAIAVLQACPTSRAKELLGISGALIGNGIIFHLFAISIIGSHYLLFWQDVDWIYDLAH